MWCLQYQVLNTFDMWDGTKKLPLQISKSFQSPLTILIQAAHIYIHYTYVYTIYILYIYYIHSIYILYAYYIYTLYTYYIYIIYIISHILYYIYPAGYIYIISYIITIVISYVYTAYLRYTAVQSRSAPGSPDFGHCLPWGFPPSESSVPAVDPLSPPPWVGCIFDPQFG